jgi:hypothetical protein
MFHVDRHISRRPVRRGCESCRGPTLDSAVTGMSGRPRRTILVGFLASTWCVKNGLSDHIRAITSKLKLYMSQSLQIIVRWFLIDFWIQRTNPVINLEKKSKWTGTFEMLFSH